MQDARLWLLHTNGETKVVVVLAFTEEKAKLEVVSGPRHPEPITPTTANHDGTTHCSTSYHQEIQRTITSNHEGSIPTIMSKEVTAPPTAGNAATVPSTTGNKATAPPTTGNERISDEATTLPTTGNDATAPPSTGNDSEENLMHTIGENTDLNDLAEKLFTLHEQGKLQHPLLGKVHASLHIFKASNEGDDIVETFSTILLPPKAVGSTAPEEFGITLRDILGNLVPAGHDPADEVCFPLGKLQKVIKDAIPRTARLRATNRAEKLLRDTVGLNEELTFAQRKRQRLNLLGQWK
ncbi:hypothetical protein HOY82DRAFT_628588 [Tuber indicum]|nr:hypothetical protein HOY82DRAFT_628588 [Tuber indicum]